MENAADFVNKFLASATATYGALLQPLRCDEHVLTIVIDHLWADGMSTQVLLDTIAGLYDCKLENSKPAISETHASIEDWISRQWRDVDRYLEREVEFWRSLLGDRSSSVVNQSTVRDNHQIESEPRNRVDRLDGLEWAALKREAGAAGVTLFAYLLARYATWHRDTARGQRLVIKTSLAGRTGLGDRHLVGPLARDVYFPLSDLLDSSELETSRNVQTRLGTIIANSRVSDFYLWDHLWPADYDHLAAPPLYISVRRIGRRLVLGGVEVQDLFMPILSVSEGVDWGIEIDESGATSMYTWKSHETPSWAQKVVTHTLGVSR
jgi:hypothetical protein